ncbi:hypothetical protein I317_04750 [Kwoniella heveanensis CBS 569]|nr:hypothetical protein I317_04750 [Kwoniella heveanensis CBS 569]
MSAPSGIKVPPSLTSAFSTAQNGGDSVRALVFIIEGESFKHHTTIDPKGNYTDDIALLAEALPNPKTPASFAYRLDSKDGFRYEWMMVTFVPDDAGVRAKMLQASSRSGLLKALGAANFKHDWFATSINDLTPAALTAHLKHLASPPPLSASEAALAEVREAEAAEAKRAALDPQVAVNRKKAVVGLGGKMSLGDGVVDALKKVAQRSDDGWVAVFEIPASNTGAISLTTSDACIPSQLASKIPPKSPSYVFYSYPTPPAPAKPSTTSASAGDSSAPRNTFQASEGGVRIAPTTWQPKTTADEASSTPAPAPAAAEETPASTPSKGRVLFIYCCPSSSPVKFRMIYSTSVRGMQQDAADQAGVEIIAKLETSDPSDLTESHLKSSLPPSKPTHSSSLPTPSKPPIFGAPAPSSSNTGSSTSANASANAFGGAFGRPRPMTQPIRSATQIPLPASGSATPIGGEPSSSGNGNGDGEGDSKENIRRAFDAFGPRVNTPGGGGGAGFARPRPAGRR